MLTGAAIGVLVSLFMLFEMRRKASKGIGLPGEVEQALAGRGPLNLKEVAALVGKDSFLGRGNVAQALAALTTAGKVRTIPAPAGTPQLQKVDHIKYERV